MNVRFGTLNVTSLYRTGLLKTAASELATCNLDPEAVQQIRRNKVGSQPAEDFIRFPIEMEMVFIT